MGKGAISEKLEIVLLCKNMKWSYETYLTQPQWFIDTLHTINNIDAEYQERLNRINKRKR